MVRRRSYLAVKGHVTPRDGSDACFGTSPIRATTLKLPESASSRHNASQGQIGSAMRRCATCSAVHVRAGGGPAR